MSWHLGNFATTHGLNKEGLQRRGFSDACIKALHQSYKLLIRNKGSRKESIRQVESLAEEHPEVRKFLDFILASKRGVVQ